MTSPETHFSQLMDFQRDTVRYVLDRFYGPDATSRFLVADEVGMGKTLVARGVIAGVIDRLDRPDSGVDRIDILYICSNADIARQNIGKLDVLGDGTRPLSTRITLLATQIRDLDRKSANGSKTVNLIAFTPGTSFAKGHSGGRYEERVLLAHLLEAEFPNDKGVRTRLRRVLRGGVGLTGWESAASKLRQPESAPSPEIAQRFSTLLHSSPIWPRLEALVAEAVKGELPKRLRREQTEVVGELRNVLASASVDSLEPDLIILDEFQRFKHLLETPDEGGETEVRELAHQLFTHKDARVLLLSATPYKMFTLPEERTLNGDDHYADFLATVRFLAHPHQADILTELAAALAEFRDRLISQGDASPAKQRIETALRSVMSRTERPTLGGAGMSSERLGGIEAPLATDLVAYADTKRLANAIGAAMSIDYWKSAPYFLNFMDGYQLSRRLRDRAAEPPIRAIVNKMPRITKANVQARRNIEPANARLRALHEETIGSGLWKLLWLPPSMPYYEQSGVFAGLDPATTTKRLIFSSWAAAPTSIAALLSHAATRAMIPQHSKAPPPRLGYDLTRGKPDTMSTLLLSVPIPELAAKCDPLTFARESPANVRPSADVVAAATIAVQPRLASTRPHVQSSSSETWFWAGPLGWGTPNTRYSTLASGMARSRVSIPDGLRQYLERADSAATGDIGLGTQPPDLAHWVAMVGLASPANCAWRALRRVFADDAEFSDETIRLAAATIGDSFRSLFNRPDVMSLLDQLKPNDQPYWQRVLEYCLDGNLQATMDEYVHHLVGNESPSDDDSLLELAARIASSVGFGRGRIQGFNPIDPDKPINFSPRFALRYGNARGALAKDDQTVERTGEVQAAFNSPFWPMLLASTSVGQEGVDFHWWCHSLVHWNLPATVVDLEQREGRVHRFKGHAVRKNVAVAHREDALRSAENDPWKAAFSAASSRRPVGMNDLWPSWGYPGPSTVESWIPYFPLSREIAREERLRKDRAIYRLAFGQARQEDLLGILEAQGMAEDSTLVEELRIDLRPPSST